MTTDTINTTSDTLISDTNHLQKDVGKIVEDVKTSAAAHVEAAKERVCDTFDLVQTCVSEHPLKLIGASLFIGFLIGTLRRK